MEKVLIVICAVLNSITKHSNDGGAYVEFPEKSCDSRNDQLSRFLTKNILGIAVVGSKKVNQLHDHVESTILYYFTVPSINRFYKKKVWSTLTGARVINKLLYNLI